MQKLKNILGSRKKGAQEPHAARDPRYDYQGNTTSNLKGISLESLTLSAGLTSYCMCPLFFLLFPSTIQEVYLILFKTCVGVFCLLSPLRELGPDAGWVQEYGGSGHQYGLSDKSLAAAAYWWAGRRTVHVVQSQTYMLIYGVMVNCIFMCWNIVLLELVLPVPLQDSYIQSRADTMQNIESTIVELGSIFQQLAHMVKEQEETIQR